MHLREHGLRGDARKAHLTNQMLQLKLVLKNKMLQLKLKIVDKWMSLIH